ncbi:MAG: hypothetical protein LKI80_05090, partial [Sporolactobacillus sp.]|nr:hypothetical protein [Sporolactobacillus sp.]
QHTATEAEKAFQIRSTPRTRTGKAIVIFQFRTRICVRVSLCDDNDIIFHLPDGSGKCVKKKTLLPFIILRILEGMSRKESGYYSAKIDRYIEIANEKRRVGFTPPAETCLAHGHYIS